MDIKLGIIGAMQVEVERLIAAMSQDKVVEIAGMVFHEGQLNGTEVVIVRCGVGKVSAAMCTQALIDRFAPTHVLNVGVAGSLDATLDIGDLVVSTDAVHHDMDVTGLGYPPGLVPELDEQAELHGKRFFEADEHLRSVVLRAAADVAPEITVVEGRVASGDLFVCEQADKERIASTFGAKCCEMEGAGIAHVCWRNEMPFVIVRTISDKADGTSKVEYRVFEEQTAQRCAAIVDRAVDLLS